MLGYLAFHCMTMADWCVRIWLATGPRGGPNSASPKPADLLACRGNVGMHAGRAASHHMAGWRPEEHLDGLTARSSERYPNYRTRLATQTSMYIRSTWLPTLPGPSLILGRAGIIARHDSLSVGPAALSSTVSAALAALPLLEVAFSGRRFGQLEAHARATAPADRPAKGCGYQPCVVLDRGHAYPYRR